MNKGHMFVRFSQREYMDELKEFVDKKEPEVMCDVISVIRRLRCRNADWDIGSKDYYKKGCIMERARYFDDVFTLYVL